VGERTIDYGWKDRTPVADASIGNGRIEPVRFPDLVEKLEEAHLPTIIEKKGTAWLLMYSSNKLVDYLYVHIRHIHEMNDVVAKIDFP
jgi:hypothetical protein